MWRTVLIVDDDSSFRSLARALLEAEGFHVIGEAADGTSALADASRLNPEVILLDIQLPDVNGFDVCERISSSTNPPAIVLISTREISSYRRRLADSKARGFISKGELTGARLAALVEGA